MKRRGITPDDDEKNFTTKRKKRFTEAYINKWEEWKSSTQPRDLKWSWQRKGKSWQMTLAVTTEHGEREEFKRWGKTKKKTQYALAEASWYHFLNRKLPEDLSEL